MEQAIYSFFWNNKHPLVNRDILALPLKDGGFNIPRLETKIQAFRLNTLKRLLSGEDAHWKYFTAYFLRVSKMRLGKLVLALDYSPQRIDRDIPTFHKELLIAWHKHKQHRTRTHIPETLVDILNEPLFLNELITVHDKPLFYADWVAAGISRVKDICYETVPGYLPTRAIHEILTGDNDTRTLSRTARELNEIHSAIPQKWARIICTDQSREPSTLQPCFDINNPNPG